MKRSLRASLVGSFAASLLLTMTQCTTSSGPENALPEGAQDYRNMWLDVIARQRALRLTEEERTDYMIFMASFDVLKLKSEFGMLNDLHAHFNRHIKFAEDATLYGKEDYWALPKQILQKPYGDCEDHALVRYAVLRHFGVPAESMMLAITTSKTQPEDHHCILLVRPGGAINPAANLSSYADLVVLDNMNASAAHYRHVKSAYNIFQLMNEKQMSLRTTTGWQTTPIHNPPSFNPPMPSYRPM